VDHKEQHHQHHEKERQHEIAQRKEQEREHSGGPRKIHPGWFVALGVVLTLLAVLVWILVV
jgi:hypothetical protein